MHIYTCFYVQSGKWAVAVSPDTFAEPSSNSLPCSFRKLPVLPLRF